MKNNFKIPHLKKEILINFIRNGLLLGIAISIILIYIAKRYEVSLQSSILFIISTLVIILLFWGSLYFYLNRKLLLPINKTCEVFYRNLKKKDGLNEGEYRENNCYKILNCRSSKRDNCPAYLNRKVKCWLLSNMKGFGENRSCEHCQVYLVCRGNELDRLVDAYNYMVNEVLGKLKDLEEREKSLVSSQEDLRLIVEEKNKALKLLTNDLNGVIGKLEEINKEFNEFIYITSHDLKEPLRSIEAFSKFLHDDYEHILDEKGREYLRILIEATEKMKIRISSLWELAKLSSEEYSYKEFNLKEVIDDSLRNIGELVKEKQPNISYNDIEAKAYGSPIMIEKVLANLISNGIKFNDKKEINVEIGSMNGKDALTVYVKDNGMGIRDIYYERIFYMFQKLNIEDGYEGSGAGLTICKKIMDKHKGNIWVESKVNEGSTFYFTLPHKKIG